MPLNPQQRIDLIMAAMENYKANLAAAKQAPGLSDLEREFVREAAAAALKTDLTSPLSLSHPPGE